MNSPHVLHIARPRRAGRLPVGPGLLVLVGSLAAIASAALMVTGSTPAPLALVTMIVVAIAAGQTVSWLAGTAATVIGMLAGLAIAMRLYPYLGLSLETSSALTLLLLNVVALIHLARRGAELRLPTRSGAGLAAAALIVPVAALVAAATIMLRSGGTKISWAMSNDATFSLMIGRFIIGDGGDDPAKHLSSAPLTYEVLAVFMAPGRSSVDPSELLNHDIGRVIQVLLLLLAAMSVLGSLTVARIVPREHVVSRVALSLLMGLVPWTWFVSGFGLKYGFNNALLAGLVITAIWAAWVESRAHPILGTAVQAMGATVLLATWAPLVLVPLGLGGVLFALAWRDHLRLRGIRLVLWLVPVLCFVWYALFATLPAFRQNSTALAVDGAIFASRPSDSVIALGLTLAVTLLGATCRRTSWQVVGILVVGATGAVGALYLVAQRVDNPLGAWGYYPAKYAWLLAMFAPVVCARAVATRLSEPSTSRLRRGGLVVAAALVVTAAMAQFDPADLRSPSAAYQFPRATPDWSLASVFPLVSIASDKGMSDQDSAVKLLMRISDPTKKVFVMRYYADRGKDTFINYWLLWQQFDEYPQINGVRGYALLEKDRISQACSIVDDWGGGVTILTRDTSLEDRVRAKCPDLDVSFALAPSEVS